MTKAKRLKNFVLTFVTYLVVGVLFDTIEYGFQQAINLLNWKDITQALFFALIMTRVLGFIPVNEKEKK